MKRTLTIIIIIVSILINCIPAYAAEEPTVNESKRLIYNIVKLDNMEYTKPNAYVTYFRTCTMHLKLIWVNRITHYFEGEFWTTDGYTYYERISGSFDGEHLEFVLKNKKDAVFEYYLNDSTGKWNGNNTFEAPFAGLMDNGGFSGQANAYKDSLEINRIILDEELYKDCRDYSVKIYKQITENTFIWNMDYINQPKKLKDTLEKDGYTDVEMKNFKDEDDSNVSYVIAHKSFQHPGIENVNLERVILVIRGTDTVEWLGNMKICPPDSQGNEDKYTFSKLEGAVHANFMKATQTMRKDLKSYIERRIGRDKETQSKIVVTATGHSRGGAVSNLLARTLVDENNFIPNVTAYTFATPNVAYCSSINHSKYMESYTNIYNFCKNKDFIPFIPLVNREWSFWKFGETYIEKSSDNDRYCNKITDIMAKEKYAPTIKEYYNYKFEHKKTKNIAMNLYYFMQLSLSMPMVDGLHPNIVKDMLTCFKDDFKGMAELSGEIKKNVDYILANHWWTAYRILKFSDYKRFTYCDALALCSEGGLTEDELSTSTKKISKNSKKYLPSSSMAADYRAKFNQFFNYTDDKGIRNIEKLGWDVDDLSTWNGVTFNEAGEITAINLEFLYLYGSLDLSNLDKLVSVDVSANYLTDVNVSGCTALRELNVSDNELSAIDITTNTNLTIFNCGYNDISEINLSNNPVIADLDVASCHLSELNISNLTDLSILNCMDNQLTTLDTTPCPQITELYCIQNYLDINDNDLQAQFDNIANKPDGKVVSEFQYLPDEAQFDENELQQILAFAAQNESLQILDNAGNVNIDSLQNYFGFKQYNGAYRVESICLADEDVAGNLDCSNFEYLKYINIAGTKIESINLENCISLEELYCSNNHLTNLDLSSCQKLQVLNCQYGNITELIFPGNILSENTALYQIDCEYNYIDTSIFTQDIVDNITAKPDASLEYLHQRDVAGGESIEISGTVTIACDEKGDFGEYGVKGLTISAEGAQSVVSDENGKFTIVVPKDATALTITGDTVIPRTVALDLTDSIANVVIPMITCDYNGDGRINYFDKVLLNARYLKSYTEDAYYYDLYQDGTINVADKDVFNYIYGRKIAYLDMVLNDQTTENNMIEINGIVTIAKNNGGREGDYGIKGMTVSAVGAQPVVSENDGSFRIIVPRGTTELTVTGETAIPRTVTLRGTDSIWDINIPVCICDYNGDGVVDNLDSAIFSMYFNQPYTDEAYYCNLKQDSSINVADKVIFNKFCNKEIFYEELLLTNPKPNSDDIEISGVVTVARNLEGTIGKRGIAGLTISAQGSAQSVVSMENGEFTIAVPRGTKKLTISGETVLARTVYLDGTKSINNVVIPMCICDYNGDSSINGADKDLFNTYYNKPYTEEAYYYDFNGDQCVDAADKIAFEAFIPRSELYSKLTLENKAALLPTEIEISGKVTIANDLQGNTGDVGVMGLSVSAEGAQSVVTDEDGDFTIVVPKGTTALTVTGSTAITRTVILSGSESVFGVEIPVCICDYDYDGIVSGADQYQFNQHYNQLYTRDFYYYDFNRDGVVNFSDKSLFNTFYNKQVVYSELTLVNYPTVLEDAIEISGTIELARNSTGASSTCYVAGLTVSAEGAQSVVSATNGSFTIMVPRGTTEITVSGAYSIPRKVSLSGTTSITGVSIPICVCDYNYDGAVDREDNIIFEKYYNKPYTDTAYYYDLNRDGVVNSADKVTFNTFYNKHIVYDALSLD